MIPIIIPGSVVKAAADGVKALDDKATGGAGQAKKKELSESASKKAAEKKKEAEESETGKAVAAKAAAASVALDEGLGKFGAWRKQKASELEAAFDEFRGPVVISQPGEQVPSFPPEELYFPESTNPRFQLMVVPHGLKEGDQLATPTGTPFEVQKHWTPGCARKPCPYSCSTAALLCLGALSAVCCASRSC